MKHAFPTIYDKLKPEFKTELNHNAKKYSSAKRLKYTLMSKTIWQELTLSELSSMTTYCDIYTSQLSASDVMYGTQILND
jgi:hypothetical protein